METTYRRVTKYKVIAQLDSPLHVGTGEPGQAEVLVRLSDGLPFIQASSLCGVMRGYYEKRFGKKATEDLFGGRTLKQDSRVRVTDADFDEKTVRYEMRPRVKIDPVTATVSKGEVKGTEQEAGHKFDMECIGKGGIFGFAVYVYDQTKDEGNRLKTVFSALNGHAITIGGQWSNGYGDVRITGLWRKEFCLEEEDDRKRWMREEDLPKGDYDDLKEQLTEIRDYAYRIEFTGKTESGVLVKGYNRSGFGKDNADDGNMTDAAGDYIIPGSSIKGTLRMQAERIVSQYGCEKKQQEDIIYNIFGSSAEDGKIGNIRISDCIIGEKADNEKNAISHRIHIDKLTGGVMHGGLFSEKRAFGDICLQIRILDNNNPKLSCGILVMVLRDLAANLISLGSGYSIGSGMIQAKSMTVYSQNGKAKLDFENNVINDEDNLVGDCLKKVKEAIS